YSGNGAPKIVLLSPIAFENTGDANLSDGATQNKNLKLYTQALQKVAKANDVAFVDLFTPTQKLFKKSNDRLTLNGAHLNSDGYAALAPILDAGLFGAAGAPAKVNAWVKAELDDKNFHWWHRYRAVNGYSIYGKRGSAGFDGTYRNTDVMERERAILDEMTANREARVWKLALGKKVSAQVDDSNTLPFINPKTNVGNDKRNDAKLGTLDYLTGAEQVKKFVLAEGYEINLFASEEDFPDLANPVALNFDNKGRLWVSTMPSYPQWKPKSKMDDKILIFEDTDKDGRADKQIIFARGLHQPTGFEIGHNGAFIAQQPDLLFLQDTDGDDKADTRIRRVVGFDTADSHHGLAAFTWGPGGGLYFNEGTFKQSQIESPQGPVRLSDAGVWRYDPKTEEFGVYASLAFANPWGHVFDKWGQSFIADASPGFNYWATPITGKVGFPDKHPGGCRDAHLDWGGSESDASYPTFIKKRIRPSSGCEIVANSHFPPEAQGDFLQNNVIGERAVLQHKVKEEDSGFVGTETTQLVSSKDGNFRPVALQFGPDGALYIIDWHNALIGHLQHNLRDPNRDHSHGRIWRVTYKGRPLVQPPKIAGESIDKLLDLLKLPEDRTRYRVRRELAARETADVMSNLKKWLASIDASDENAEHHRLEALWLCQTHNQINESLLKELLESKDYHVRAAATRVLSYWRDKVDNSLALVKKRIHDDHPRVRLEAVRACSFYDSKQASEIALDVLNYDTDTYLDYTLDETIRSLEK
ncbi:MAG: azurin, partial [Blastopirellula sp.]